MELRCKLSQSTYPLGSFATGTAADFALVRSIVVPLGDVIGVGGLDNTGSPVAAFIAPADDCTFENAIVTMQRPYAAQQML